MPRWCRHASTAPESCSCEGNLMQCPRCQTVNREGRRFCSKCAAPLAVVCGSCGFTNDPGDEFCGGCALPLRSATPMPPKFQAPETYTPKHLAEKILTSKAAVEGERKQVTVLFADLKANQCYERFGAAASGRRSRGPTSPTCSPSSAGSTRPSGTPRPRCGPLKRPIIPTRCSSGCSISAAPTSVGGISRAGPG